MSRIENYYEAYVMDCPMCFLTLRLPADIKPDGTEDCDLGKRICMRCASVLQFDYRKDINMVVATFVRENDCES